MMAPEKEKKERTLINEKIRAEYVQLINHLGENAGIVSREAALRTARDANLDLVMIAEKGAKDVPVVKVMDHGKALYEKKKKLAESKKHQKIILFKEIKIRPKIGEHDYQIKMKQMISFLKEGKRVKVSLSFKGRENVLKDERGNELFEKIDRTIEDHGLANNIIKEKDVKMGRLWSRVYYLKGK